MGKELERRQFLKELGVCGVGAVVGTGVLGCEDLESSEPKTESENVKSPKNPTVEPEKVEKKVDPLVEARSKADQAGRDLAEQVIKRTSEKQFPMRVPGKVLEIRKSGAMKNKKKIDEEIAREILREGLKRFTGEKTVAAALGRFVSPDDVVGIKVNTLGFPMASFNPVSAFVLVDGLKELGVKPGNIVVYDQYPKRFKGSGYKIRKKAEDVKVISNYTWKYENKPTEHQAGSSHFCNILKKVTVVINCCIPKDHDLTGITGAIKNMAFGNIKKVSKFHRKNCNPQLAQIYSHPLIKDKVRLNVCDALRILYHGGPQDNQRYKALHNAYLISTDPVSMDVAILDLVNHYRKLNDMVPVEEDKKRFRPPVFIKTCEEYGLGIADREKIVLEKIDLDKA